MKRGKGDDGEGITKKVCVWGGYIHGAKGRGSIAKAPEPLNVFCQGIKDQLTAAAAYQHSERECKSALMQMSLVFRGKTDCLYANTLKHKHTPLQSCTESHSQQHIQEATVRRA